MRINTYIFLCSIILAFCQCDSNLIGDLDLDYVGNRLTLLGYISPGEVRLTVGRTQPADASFLLKELLAPADTRVELLDEKDQLIVTLNTTDQRLYTAQTPPLTVGNAYRIRATASGFPSVETPLLVIPAATQDMKFQPMRPIESPNGLGVQLDFSFLDTDSTVNFYYTEFATVKNKKTSNTLTWVINGQWQEKCFSTFSFKDECFNGRRAMLQYGVDRTLTTILGRPPADTLLLRFGEVSEDLYQYERRNVKSNDGLIQGINEPAITYTNIKNGFGMVFAQNWKEYVLIIK